MDVEKEKSDERPAAGFSDFSAMAEDDVWEAGEAIRLPSRGRIFRTNCDAAEERELGKICPRPPPGMRIYKFGSRSVVGAFRLASGRTVCLKYYFPKNWAKRVSYGLGGSRCARSWAAAFAFLRAGIPTPAPVVFGEWKGLGGCFLERAFLATDDASGIPLTDYANLHRNDTEKLEAAAAKLREYFARMAELRMVHGDLKATNILVDENGGISFIDLDGAEWEMKLPAWRKSRERDERIFADNWKRDPEFREIFRDVFAR